MSADEVPLMLSLAWSDEGVAVFDRKQFVLKETNIEKPQVGNRSRDRVVRTVLLLRRIREVSARKGFKFCT